MDDLTVFAVKGWAEKNGLALVPKKTELCSPLSDCIAEYICDGTYVDDESVQKAWDDLLKAANEEGE